MQTSWGLRRATEGLPLLLISGIFLIRIDNAGEALNDRGTGRYIVLTHENLRMYICLLECVKRMLPLPSHFPLHLPIIRRELLPSERADALPEPAPLRQPLICTHRPNIRLACNSPIENHLLAREPLFTGKLGPTRSDVVSSRC